MTETWKPIPGWEDKFEVSDHGRVRSFPRVATVACRWGKGRTLTVPGRELAVQVNRKGYRFVQLQYGIGGAKTHATLAIHRLVLEAFVGPRPVGMECRHLDGCPENNQLENLCWGTQAENMQDRARHAKPGATKLTPTKVRWIRSWLAVGVHWKRIADHLGVSEACIRDVRRGATWAWVPR